ncbi:hypothetical protein KFL_002100110 [Klebsormidium nitens]|uniref:Uncharacterized protein n=1 Tax=Klebsormidium nitens TaxID=105231 RepID=A0A1Y1I6W4_KLENI|nr:hypothetical protein KFL_002100110 [Klebsormidium nitens]|eukprot:GAQ84881.1 hypothetical protein KFL_002100110 [Klebsormidium nitens]
MKPAIDYICMVKAGKAETQLVQNLEIVKLFPIPVVEDGNVVFRQAGFPTAGAHLLKDITAEELEPLWKDLKPEVFGKYHDPFRFVIDLSSAPVVGTPSPAGSNTSSPAASPRPGSPTSASKTATTFERDKRGGSTSSTSFEDAPPKSEHQAAADDIPSTSAPAVTTTTHYISRQGDEFKATIISFQDGGPVQQGPMKLKKYYSDYAHGQLASPTHIVFTNGVPPDFFQRG